MKYQIGKSNHNNPKICVAEATKDLSNPLLIIYFSQVESFSDYTFELKEKFPDSIIIGSTTYASFCSNGAYKDTLMVLGLESGIECRANILEEVDKYPLKYINVVEETARDFCSNGDTICFEVTTALMNCEEFVLSTLNSILEKKNIPVFGGSAGDQGRAQKTLVGFNGRVYENGCAFVIIKNLGGKVHLYRENIYKPKTNHFTATKVDEKNRRVFEFNNQPAAEYIANALNISLKELPKYLDSYPLGRIIGNEMFITANEAIHENNSMGYHARVYKNSRMVILEPDDYSKVLEETRRVVSSDIKNPSLSLMVNCLARSILFDNAGYIDRFATDMGQALGDYIGFAGYGEQLRQQHFNQTMILAVFE